MEHWRDVLLGIGYTLLTAMFGSMTIGMAAEYTLLVMERYAEKEERLHDNLAAIQESVHKIGATIAVSGLATFFGFSALYLASFLIISNFGITTLIAAGFSIMGAMFIMPAVLSIMGVFTAWLEEKNRIPNRPPHFFGFAEKNSAHFQLLQQRSHLRPVKSLIHISSVKNY